MYRRWTRKEEVIEAGRSWMAEHERQPTYNEWRKAPPGMPSRGAIERLCGSWPEWIEAIGGVPLARGELLPGQERGGGGTEYWTPERIVEAILRWVRERGEPPNCVAWRPAVEGYPSCETVEQKFGSFRAALEAAGIEVPGPWTKERCIERIRHFRREHGRWPTQDDFHTASRPDYPSVMVVWRHCGSWSEAIRAAGGIPYQERRKAARPERNGTSRESPLRRSEHEQGTEAPAA